MTSFLLEELKISFLQSVKSYAFWQIDFSAKLKFLPKTFSALNFYSLLTLLPFKFLQIDHFFCLLQFCRITFSAIQFSAVWH